jgi:hypothetical protein
MALTDNGTGLERRDFLKLAGAATALSLTPSAFAAASTGRVVLLVDPTHESVADPAVQWAAGWLRDALTAKGAVCEIASSTDGVRGASHCVVVARPQSTLAHGFANTHALNAPESVQWSPGSLDRTPATLVTANDVRGFVYGLLELAERVQYGRDAMAGLQLSRSIAETPANDVRGVGRYFCCELEDKPWYYDKEFWPAYLDTLAASRFNRFTLAYGLGYDFPRDVTSDYLHYVYPYLLEVPGYEQVHVLQLATADGKRLDTPVPLSTEERARNLDALKFIARQTAQRGLHFQLGMWTHAYEWTDSPHAYHHIEGLTPQTHAAYSRDALAILLREIPEIQGLTLRVHGESGIPEGSYGFWSTLFEAVTHCGRTIEIDMHAKGVDQKMIDIAVATGMPVRLGAKYSAEHQSLGYQQADIREFERPKANAPGKPDALFSLSNGSRGFTRYGYADFLREGTQYKLLFRLWAGTQRHLLCVDPAIISGFARTASFCGAVGLDLMEPLTFKGREGSGRPWGRCAYADTTLNPRADWEKYAYYYRAWGRLLYNPDAAPDTWQRFLRVEFGPAAPAVETSLAHASRVLALMTSAHLDSASNRSLWYEMAPNMPIVAGSEPSPHGDTPTPRCFGTVSPLDPQMFSTVVEYVGALLQGKPGAKYSPAEVAQWVEDLTSTAKQSLNEARVKVSSPRSSTFRRLEEDLLIQIAVGEFFAAKLRSAMLYEVFLRSGDAEAGRLALERYRQARDAWAAMAERAKNVYRPDVSYGEIPQRRGHWSDRLPAIDTDLAAMQAKVQSSSQASAGAARPQAAVRTIAARPSRPNPRYVHSVPERFTAGQALTLVLQQPAGAEKPDTVRLFYRHVDQAERWTSLEMTVEGNRYRAEIPAAYTNSAYALQYYFELERGAAAWMYPGFNQTLSNQPYFAISQRTPA